MAYYEDSQQRIEKLLASSERVFQRRFMETISSIKSQFTLDELEDLLSKGQLDDALAIADAAARNLASAYTLAFISSAEDTARFISDMLSVVIRFDQTNQYAIEQMRRNQLRMIREFTEEQRQATRMALIEGVSQGVNPLQQAVLFRDSIGLTRHQLEVIQNYRESLERNSADALDRELRDGRWDRSVENAIQTGNRLSPQMIDRMVNRYRENWISFRAETIARTESLPAVHLGVDNMFQQAIDQGILDGEDLVETWHPAKDKRVRDSHSAMRGQQRPFGEPFLSGNGNLLRYPGDEDAPADDRVHCRCVKTKRFKEDAHLAAGVLQVP